MPPPQLFPPILNNDPIAGIPYYRHTETPTQPTALISRPASSRSPPIQARFPTTSRTCSRFIHPSVSDKGIDNGGLTVQQVPGNMLGARARAAEYNAAKAASARQQASRSELEQPPKPAPVSLSAFTRNASITRNKGTKSFVPLVLSEEEERSQSSLEVGSEHNENNRPPIRSLTPAPGSVPPRAASLPPRPISQPVVVSRADTKRSIQTPYRHRDHQIHDYSTRTMYPDDGYVFAQPLPLSYAPHYLQYSYPTHPLIVQPMLSTPNAGWFVPLEDYSTHYSYPHTGLSPMPLTPLAEARPVLRQNLSYDLVTNHDEPQEALSSSGLAPERAENETPTTPLIDASNLYVFHPDDVTPTKMEAKHKAREKYFTEHPVALLATSTAVADKSAGTPGWCQVENEAVPMQLPQNRAPSRVPLAPISANSVKELLIDHKIIAPVSNRSTSRNSAAFPKLHDTSTAPLVQGRMEADWPYLGQPRAYQDIVHDNAVTPTKGIRNAQPPELGEDIKRLLRAAMVAQTQTASSVTIRPPPGLEKTQASDAHFERLGSEQITNFKFPLVDPESAEWHEVRMPTTAERDRMRRVCHEIRTSSISNKNGGLRGDLGEVLRNDLDKWIEASGKEYQSRKKRVDDLANEMQRKWEHGGSFRTATMTKGEAQQHAATVRAVGSIMATLSMQTEDSTGYHHRGSRPYCAAPEYTIERSVGLDKNGRSKSLFEPDNDAQAVKAAPARLARDPRFRPQLGNGIKSRTEEIHVPRIFAARRAM